MDVRLQQGCRGFLAKLLFLLLAANFYLTAQAQDHAMNSMTQMAMGPRDCTKMQVWDYSTGSCQNLAMKGMPMGMWMVHGNAFLVQSVEEGSRGRNEFSVPNMFTTDIGHSAGDTHYLNANLMLTAERWTFPERGYPELLQIGEHNRAGEPYIDAQHPHSSPIMGLTLSDTIRLSESKNYLKLFFAPRGQATEGPTPFMHRPSGMINPDAPLGHHIGQDVSHITSTVIGASLGVGPARIELSTFNGQEPEPSKVDLPLGPLNSYAGRFIYEFSPSWAVMASAAYVEDPEPDDPDLPKVYRYSASAYNNHDLGSGWMIHNSFVFGLVNYYDHVPALRSYLEEFWVHSKDLPHNFWGRVELVERTAAELNTPAIPNSNGSKWVTAVTAGYTYDLIERSSGKLSAGISVTKDILPSDFRPAYSTDPLSGRIFVQLSGMNMGHY